MFAIENVLGVDDGAGPTKSVELSPVVAKSVEPWTQRLELLQNGVGSILPKRRIIPDSLRNMEDSAICCFVCELERDTFVSSDLVSKVDAYDCHIDIAGVLPIRCQYRYQDHLYRR